MVTDTDFDMRLWAELMARVLTAGGVTSRELELRVHKRLENDLGLRVSVRVVGPGEIERSEGQARCVIDRRGGGD